MKLSAGSRPITFAETARGRSEIQCSIKMLAAELLKCSTKNSIRKILSLKINLPTSIYIQLCTEE